MEGDKQTAFKDLEELLGVFFLLWVPPVTVEALKKEFHEWKEKMDALAVESALSCLQMVIAPPAALFDPYAAIWVKWSTLRRKRRMNERRVMK